MNDQQESIGVGFNVPQISLIRISSIKPTGDEYFADPKSTGLYNLGMAKIDGDGNVKLLGYAMAPWGFTRLTWLQWSYASATWCNNGLSGPVTIYTPLNSNNGTYVRLNAILILSNPSEMRSEYRYNDAQFKFTRLRLPT